MFAKKKFKLRPARSAVAGFTAAGLFFVCVVADAQRAGGERPSRFMDRIDAEEGAAKLTAFRGQRLAGDFYFEFQLEHKPRRARTVRYNGKMWGTWKGQGPLSRIAIDPNPVHGNTAPQATQPVELIIQSGPVPAAWIRRSGGEGFEPIEGAALFEPILAGLLYSPFDLQMPFVYWERFQYEGPALAMGSRVAQQFLMLPPEKSASAQWGISGVRIGLDDTYDALLTIEVMDSEMVASWRVAVESVRKVQSQYIVKRMTLTDYPSKDRTTFNVTAAAVGLSLQRDLFAPDANVEAEVYIPGSPEKL